MKSIKYDDLIAQTMSELKKGGWDAAFSFIDDYIQKTPIIEAYLVRSEMYLEKGDFQNALKDIEKSITIDPTEAKAYFNRGLAHAKSGGDAKKSLDDFTKAIELNVNYAGAYTNRANIYLQMSEFQKAIMDCNKAIELSPNEAEPYYNRGLAYFNMEEPKKAFKDYNKVIELDPENAEAFFKRGFLNSQSGNTQEAISDYEEFLRLDPNNTNAKLVRDELRQLKSGKTAKSNKAPANIKRKHLLIFSAIGFVLGTIIGAVNGSVILGMWLGIGGGVGLSFLPEIPDLFKGAYKRRGFVYAFQTVLGGGGLWFVIFIVAGPIGFIIRFIRTR